MLVSAYFLGYRELLLWKLLRCQQIILQREDPEFFRA